MSVWRSRIADAQTSSAGGEATDTVQAHRLRIEEKSKAAESGDPDSIRGLADEVFNHPHRFGTLPDLVKEPVKEQVIRAEMDYRAGFGHAITHGDVARTVNWLSDKLGLPNYTKTSEHQILEMRLHSVALTPHFMGKNLSKSESGKHLQVGDSMNTKMSPLQASHLLMFAIDSKLGNPDYQVTPEEWEAYRYQQNLKKWQDHQQALALGKDQEEMSAEQRSKVKPRLVARGTKKVEIVRAAESRLLTLNPDESARLAQSTLDTLGIRASH